MLTRTDNAEYGFYSIHHLNNNVCIKGDMFLTFAVFHMLFIWLHDAHYAQTTKGDVHDWLHIMIHDEKPTFTTHGLLGNSFNITIKH